jgi:hypothetical protein
MYKRGTNMCGGHSAVDFNLDVEFDLAIDPVLI